MLTRDEFEELSEEEQEKIFQDACAKVYEDAQGNVYESNCAYFVITEDDIYEIPTNTGDTPKGGSYLDLFYGPAKEKQDAAKIIMDKYSIDEYFFINIYDWPEDYDLEGEEAFSVFEGNDDDKRNSGIIREIQNTVISGKTPFKTVAEVAETFKLYGLDPACQYYEYDGEYFEVEENILECGEPRGTYSGNSDYDWLEILDNLDDYLA